MLSIYTPSYEEIQHVWTCLPHHLTAKLKVRGQLLSFLLQVLLLEEKAGSALIGTSVFISVIKHL